MSDYRPAELVDTYDVAETTAEAKRIDGREEQMSPAAFFARMLSPLSRPVPIGSRENGTSLAYRMTTDTVRYDPELGMFIFSNGPERKYAAVFVIEEWSSPMYETHMLELISYPIEMTVCHDIQPIGKGKAMATLRWQEKMAPGLQPGSDSAQQFSIVAQAIERGSEEEQEIAHVQTTITVYGDTPDEVLAGRGIINQLKMVGITPVWRLLAPSSPFKMVVTRSCETARSKRRRKASSGRKKSQPISLPGYSRKRRHGNFPCRW